MYYYHKYAGAFTTYLLLFPIYLLPQCLYSTFATPPITPFSHYLPTHTFPPIDSLRSHPIPAPDSDYRTVTQCDLPFRSVWRMVIPLHVVYPIHIRCFLYPVHYLPLQIEYALRSTIYLLLPPYLCPACLLPPPLCPTPLPCLCSCISPLPSLYLPSFPITLTHPLDIALPLVPTRPYYALRLFGWSCYFAALPLRSVDAATATRSRLYVIAARLIHLPHKLPTTFIHVSHFVRSLPTYMPRCRCVCLVLPLPAVLPTFYHRCPFTANFFYL